MARIVVVFNADYGEPSQAAPDAASVEDAAGAIARGLGTRGHDVELASIRGREVVATLDELARRAPDLVFNLCESLAGSVTNEPTFAGLLELFGLRYTGSDLLALASCLHKPRTKDILYAHGVATPPYRTLADEHALADPALDGLDYPWFVKLAHEDASVGITEANVVRDASALRARVSELMHEYRQGVLAERYVAGRELNVTLLGAAGREPRVLPLHEIDFSAMPADRPKIVSYAAKWHEGHVDFAGTVAVPLGDAAAPLVAAAARVARAAWHALGLRDYARVDLRVDAEGTPWVIDVNPNPDLSPDAGCARAAAAAGLSHADLVAMIVDLALAR